MSSPAYQAKLAKYRHDHFDAPSSSGDSSGHAVDAGGVARELDLGEDGGQEEHAATSAGRAEPGQGHGQGQGGCARTAGSESGSVESEIPAPAPAPAAAAAVDDSAANEDPDPELDGLV